MATTKPEPTAEPTKIVEFRADNFKRLTAVRIRPDGAIVPIIGLNDQGKTSLLDAIAVTLGGRDLAPREPIKKGKNEALLSAQLTNGLTVQRRFIRREDGSIKSDLRIESDGAVLKSPQQVLDRMFGVLAFNPLAFASMERKKQFELLKGLVVGFDFEANAAARKAAFDERTIVNRRRDDASSAAARIEIPLGPIPVAVDVDALTNDLARAASTNAEIEGRRTRRVAAEQELEALETQIEALTARAASLRTRIEGAEPLPALVDVNALQAQIRAGNASNEVLARAGTREVHLRTAQERGEESVALSAEIDRLDAEKFTAIAGAKMPVAGLGFGEDEILLNDVPFEQASGRDKLAVSVAIGMALNPTLRVMLIDEASSLDPGGMKLIADMAAAADFQIWLVRVAEAGRTGILIEDGHVAS